MERVFYEDVFRALNRHGVRYLVVGGVAVNLSGVPRMTKDLDLMLDLGAGNVRLFLSAVKDLGYRPRAVDVFLDNPIDFESAYASRQANAFTALFATEETKRLHDRFRSGAL